MLKQYLYHLGIVLTIVILPTLSMDQKSVLDYEKQREAVLDLEQNKLFLGSALTLNSKELKVDRALIELKGAELANKSFWYDNFLIGKESMEKSKVFQFIRKLPKGASLHTHLLAALDVDFIIENFTYEDNVYACLNDLDIFKLKVLDNGKSDANCAWKSLKTYRKEYNDIGENFDDYLKTKMSLGLDSLSQNKETVWKNFKDTFSCLYDLIAYRPVFEKYIYRLLEELYKDNIFYTELRGTFMPLYELNGTVHDTKSFFDIFIGTVDKFRNDHPGFVGAKYIHSIYRGVDNETLKTGIEDLIYYKSLYPDFIAGFDFVGLEEDGGTLFDFRSELLAVSKDLKFYFHAGETNQFGRTDLNLLDAILLNCSRIGHGFALAKHPKLRKMAFDRKIAIELCPISNQVLKLNEDPRNHPATVLLAENYPLVVCNDDPSVWGASGLSYDWYVVFMAMTWQNHGLKVLKQLAINSITYSGMEENEKIRALNLWQKQWDRFIDDMVEEPF